MKIQILPAETLADALRRKLGREPSYEEVILAFGGRFTGESIVRPKPLDGEIYDENAKPKHIL